MKTKRVRMLKTQSGMHPGFFTGTGQYHCRLGHEYDVPVELADAWLAADPPVAETEAAAEPVAVPEPVSRPARRVDVEKPSTDGGDQ